MSNVAAVGSDINRTNAVQIESFTNDLHFPKQPRSRIVYIVVVVVMNKLQAYCVYP